MERTSELDCIRRFLTHLREGTSDLAPEPLCLPVSHYVDPDHLAREREAVFRRQPTLVALSCDLPRTGSYFPVDVGGVPILLMRHSDRQVRAFVNACRHRGSPLAEAGGCAEGGRIRCPFHAWTYATDGRLDSIPLAEEAFASFDRDGMGLRPRACLEAGGLIFVRGEGDQEIDAAEALAGVGDDLECMDLARYHPFETRTTDWACNWKLVLDTFLESYHVFSLHRETVHPWYHSMPMIYDGWGANIRFPVARRTLASLADQPEESWRLADHATVQWLVGANALISHTRDYLLLWRFMSPSPGRCQARTTLYAASPIETEADRKRLTAAFDLQMRVTSAEDFPQQERIQAVLASGAVPELVYGRNEVATIHFHKALETILRGGASA